jgi:hypothetical protein
MARSVPGRIRDPRGIGFGRSGCGQPHLRDQAATGAGAEPYATVVGPSHGTHDRQPHARSRTSRSSVAEALKRLEQRRRRFRRHALAAVLHPHERVVFPACDLDLGESAGLVVEDPVLDQVPHQLPEEPALA